MIVKPWFIITLSLLIIGCSQKASLHIGVTTTLEDSGLLTALVNEFEQQHGIAIKPIIAGSGQIHHLLKQGDIDSAITHFPEGEQALFAAGIIEKPIYLMHNDFVLVGPKDDPAHASHALTLDEAFRKIIHVKATLVSRRDNSGTYQMEKYWWEKTPLSKDSEYIIQTGTGMGASLTVAAERNAYILVDRATWINFANKQQLTLLFEDADYLQNTYHLLSTTHTKKNQQIILWEQWLINEGKSIIQRYRINNQSVFLTH